ncbi:hypothetical protein PR048_022070 [Dryococelus australis]|uniref:Uncharacterized protein n=1 Tax=Dryococelus australis TaxID=614101 RepID=A0ABQ9H027_9NEOP|nr:hypothetical protein PR048_022070 [Dryococelus australis]
MQVGAGHYPASLFTPPNEPERSSPRLSQVTCETRARLTILQPPSSPIIGYSRELNTMSTYTRQKAKSKYRNRIRLERAPPKKSSVTHKTPCDRVKRCQERLFLGSPSKRDSSRVCRTSRHCLGRRVRATKVVGVERGVFSGVGRMVFDSYSDAACLVGRDTSHRAQGVNWGFPAAGEATIAVNLGPLGSVQSTRGGVLALFNLPPAHTNQLLYLSYCDNSTIESLRGGRGVVVARLLAYLQGEPGSIPGRLPPGFSHVGIVWDNAAGRWVFSGISRFPPPCPCIPALLHIHITSPSSALKTSMLRAAQISPSHSPLKAHTAFRRFAHSGDEALEALAIIALVAFLFLFIRSGKSLEIDGRLMLGQSVCVVGRKISASSDGRIMLRFQRSVICRAVVPGLQRAQLTFSDWPAGLARHCPGRGSKGVFAWGGWQGLICVRAREHAVTSRPALWSSVVWLASRHTNAEEYRS